MSHLIETLATRPDVAALLEGQWANRDALLNEALAIQAVPAPTFDERARADLIERRFVAIRLERVAQDDLGNVYGVVRGRDSSLPGVLVSAHLDTVFPAGTELQTRTGNNGARVYGPGLGDNSLGLAALTIAARQLDLYGIRPLADVWWVATVGEEGLGNLRGIRHAVERLAGQVGLAIVIEGMALGRVYHAGLGVRRLCISVQGPGGHSWLHHGRPSAIHHLLRLGAALVDETPVPSAPRSSLNVGLIEGGTSINTIAPDASLSLDLRSVDPVALARLEQQVIALVERRRDGELKTSVEVIGDRPAAMLAVSHPLVQAASAALKLVNVGRVSLEIGSTDANALLAQGIPTVCIGITTGGNAHRTDEFIDTAPLAVGMQQLLLLTLAASEQAATWSQWDNAR